jgi:2-dehydropantoate 2-reductase
MNILTIGAGAIGGWLAGALATGGASVAILARGATRDAIRARGLIVRDGETVRTHRLAVSDAVADLPKPDAILLTVKQYDFAAAIAQIAPVLRPGVVVATAMNGAPWWFLDGLDGPLDGQRLERLDPGAARAALRGVAPVAAVVHASTRVAAPGDIAIVKAFRVILGQPDGGASDATRELARLLAAGGVEAPISDVIRVDIWSKLWGNMCTNPISALTRLSATPILDDPLLAGLQRRMMQEFAALGERIGVRLPATVDDRLRVTRSLGDFRTSMYEDAIAGRRLEIEGLLGVVVEMAERVGMDAPASRAVYALARGLDRALRG